MNFTIKPAVFLRMLELATEERPRRQPGRASLRLIACEGRLCVESGGKVIEAAALIWQEGQCCVPAAELVRALKRHQTEATLRLAADEHGLHVGQSCLPVSGFSPQASLPTDCDTYLAGDLDLLPPEPVRAMMSGGFKS